MITLDAPIIMAGVTIFALLSWWLTPESGWLPKTRITHFIESTGEGDAAASNERISDDGDEHAGAKINERP
jgi:hypothetical protein